MTNDVAAAIACLYTDTPGRKFLIDEVPDVPNVIWLSACSGHGAKHSAAIGEQVAHWLWSGQRPDLLSSMTFDRFQDRSPTPQALV